MATWEQKHLSVAICVYCIMSDPKEFLSQDDVFQRSMGFNKNIFLFVNHVGDLW